MSMLRPAVNQLISPDESVYSLVVGIAKRAREIADEIDADPERRLDEKPVKMAVEEFANKKFKIYTEPTIKQ